LLLLVEQLRRLIADLLLDCGVITDLSCSSGILATPTLLWDHAAFRKAVRDHNQSRIRHSAEIIVACRLPRRLEVILVRHMPSYLTGLPAKIMVAAHADLFVLRRHCQVRLRPMPTYAMEGGLANFD
jgi:hypothetical protein